MDPIQILFPIFPIILLTHLHTAMNAMTLRESIKSKELDWRWLKYMPSWQAIPDNVQSSRELYKNLHQAPLIFYCYCILAFTVGHVTLFTLVLAWLYTAFRIIHFIIRSTNPKLSRRAPIFQVAFMASLALWLELLIHISR